MRQTIDPSLVMPDADISLKAGAIAPWARSSSDYYNQTLEALGKAYGFKLADSWKKLSEEAHRAILYGTDKKEIRFIYHDGAHSYAADKPFEGVILNMERRRKETDSA